jgi:hypothetical protein
MAPVRGLAHHFATGDFLDATLTFADRHTAISDAMGLGERRENSTFSVRKLVESRRQAWHGSGRDALGPSVAWEYLEVPAAA